MSKAQEIGQKVQGQTLDAVRKTQDAVVEAVTAWTETANKALATQVHQAVPDCRRGHRFQFRLRPADPDQPARLRTRIIAAITPKAAAEAKTSAPKAAKKTAPAAAKKSAARKTVTAAKKSSAVQPRARRSKSQ